MVGTTFDGPLYADVRTDLARSSVPVLTKIF